MLSNLIESESFRNFVSARCEEILRDDKEFKKLNSDILKIEAELMSLLNEEQTEIFLKYEEAISKYESLTIFLVYKASFNDAKPLSADVNL